VSDDVKALMLKKQWGIEEPQPVIAVPLLPLLRFVTAAYRSIGFGQGWATLLGETGRPLRTEMDRLERSLNCEAADIFR
jgi:hypothetical protein